MADPDDAADLVAAAADELYRAEPDSFVERRQALAAEAREHKNAAAAKAIAALRKPTRGAWVLNRFARTEPDVIAQLAELAGELRAAQQALDGARMRELSANRRRLLDAVSRQALAGAGLADAATALREEVVNTLTSALADEDVASELCEGTLLRSVQVSGFGDTSVSLPATAKVATKGTGSPPARAADRSATAKAAAQKRTAAAEAAAQKQAAREAERRAARRRAELEAAEKTLRDAEAAQADAEDRVRMVREQLGDAQRRLDEARLDARHAAAGVKAATRRVPSS